MPKVVVKGSLMSIRFECPTSISPYQVSNSKNQDAYILNQSHSLVLRPHLHLHEVNVTVAKKQEENSVMWTDTTYLKATESY